MKKTKSSLSLFSIALLFSHPSFGANTFPATGNVGIGTASPTQPLSLVGTLQQTSPTFTGTNTITYNANNTVSFINANIGEYLRAGPTNVVNFMGQQVVANIFGSQFGNTQGGYALQTTSGAVKLGTLAGTGTRYVTADANGVLSASTSTSGPTPTLQQVLTAGSALTASNFITVGSDPTKRLTFGATTDNPIFFQSGVFAEGMMVEDGLHTSNYTVTPQDVFLIGDTQANNITFTIPLTQRSGSILIFKKIAAANTITITAPGLFIDGQSTYTLSAQYSSVTIIGGGNANYYVIAKM